MGYNAIITTVSFVFFGVITAHPCLAEDTLSKKYPSVLLLQLRSEHNRLDALRKANMYKEAEEVEKDAQEVQLRMKMDFGDNFNFCPVYYYIDSNADLVKQKMFSGILMNRDGTPATNVAVDKDASGYMVVFYGYPADRATDSANYFANNGETSGKGLIVLDDKFRQIGYVYRLGTAEITIGPKTKKYYYSSKHYEIDYYPLAGRLSQKLFKLKAKAARRH